MYRLIALLNRPYPRSFTKVPFLVSKEDETRWLYAYDGAADARPKAQDYEDFRQMMHHMRVVRHLRIEIEQEPVGKLIGWLGSEFLLECRRLGLAEPSIPANARACPSDYNPQVADGTFWLEPTAHAYGRLEAWLLAAAPEAFQRRSREVAVLMRWCLPFHPETQAALWCTSISDTARRDALSRSLRLLIGKEPGLTRQKLQDRFQAMADRYRRKT